MQSEGCTSRMGSLAEVLCWAPACFQLQHVRLRLDMRAKHTTLWFLVTVMKKLKRFKGRLEIVLKWRSLLGCLNIKEIFCSDKNKGNGCLKQYFLLYLFLLTEINIFAINLSWSLEYPQINSWRRQASFWSPKDFTVVAMGWRFQCLMIETERETHMIGALTRLDCHFPECVIKLYSLLSHSHSSANRVLSARDVFLFLG